MFDRDEAPQPEITEAQSKGKASGGARTARDRDNDYHARKCKLTHLTALWAAFLLAVLLRVKACSERAAIGSLLLAFLVQDLFSLHVADQPVYTDIPGNHPEPKLPEPVQARRGAHPDLRARLEAIPRYHSDANMVDHVGKQLQTAFSNMLTLLFACRLKRLVSLAGAKVVLCTNEHQRRFGEGEVLVIPAMQAEVVLQRGLLGLEEGERVTHGWLENPTNRSRLLRHAVHTTREMEAAMAAWQLDMVPWQQSELTKRPGRQSEPRPPRPPTLYAITPTSKCRIKQALAYALLSLQTSSRRMFYDRDVSATLHIFRPGLG
ncbi:hypothetical protein QJQ45_005274 [Haematococcus lacustris]|nr:hypothetical protein QJQ45_005274 [Haematococcus lacustris]